MSICGWKCFHSKKNILMWKELTFESEIVENLNVRLCLTLDKNKKVGQHISLKIINPLL